VRNRRKTRTVLRRCAVTARGNLVEVSTGPIRRTKMRLDSRGANLTRPRSAKVAFLFHTPPAVAIVYAHRTDTTRSALFVNPRVRPPRNDEKQKKEKNLGFRRRYRWTLISCTSNEINSGSDARVDYDVFDRLAYVTYYYYTVFVGRFRCFQLVCVRNVNDNCTRIVRLYRR